MSPTLYSERKEVVMDNMRDVPLFGNSDEDVHCVQAVIQMVLKEHLPDRDYPLWYLDMVTHHFQGGWTWDTSVFRFLLDLGLELRVWSVFDFVRFANEGEAYLSTIWNAEEFRLQSINANLQFEQLLARDFWMVERPLLTYTRNVLTKSDICALFDQGYLVVVSVNAYALDDEKGNCGHYVLLTGYDETHVAFNDVGKPAVKNRTVTWDKFESARLEYSTAFAVRPQTGSCMHTAS